MAYHFENFSATKQNYSAYDKELYVSVQSINHLRHYLLGKETIVHTNHMPLQFLQSQSKIEEA